MRSIRLSLIIYFLALLTLALGAVSWLVYRTTAQTLHDREEASRVLVHNQYDRRCEEARKALDIRLLAQAHTLATMTRTVVNHYENLYPLGAIGASFAPQGYLAVPLWVAEAAHPPIAKKIHVMRPADVVTELPDDLIPKSSPTEPQEYFQSYRINGQPQQRSVSMGTNWFSLPSRARDSLDFYRQIFDDVQLSSGARLRRVTLKAAADHYRAGSLPWPPKFHWWPRRLPGQGPGRGPKGPPPVLGSPGYETPFPFAFIQYASDVGPMEATLTELAHEREARLGELDNETQKNLHQLRSRLMWICLVTLASLWFGGVLIVHFGLTPLARLSDAVSRVSPRDFRLPLEGRPLPVELRPIVQRLTGTLELLQQAFLREKQAAADISHELRTPLAALLTTVEVALRKARSAEEYRETLEECQGSGRQMQHLVERLLALARLDAGADPYRPCNVDLAEVATQCADLVRPLARAKGLALRVHATAPTPLHTDPNKMREIVTNLLHNAIEYNRDGGSIDLAVERVNGHISLEVRDTGIGIAPEARERIFERFFRADPSRHADTPHAGLGLAIVKSYVDLMGGRIGVDSDANGSRFHVELPASA